VVALIARPEEFLPAVPHPRRRSPGNQRHGLSRGARPDHGEARAAKQSDI